MWIPLKIQERKKSLKCTRVLVGQKAQNHNPLNRNRKVEKASRRKRIKKLNEILALLFIKRAKKALSKLLILNVINLY